MPRLITALACLSLLLAPGCGAEEPPPDAAPEDAATALTGTVSLTWTVSQGGAQVACGDVGAVTVSLQLVPAAGGSGIVAGFPCNDGAGTSQALPVDVYNATLGLRGSAGAIGADTQILGVEVLAGRDTSLGANDLSAD